MEVRCELCTAVYKIDDERLAGGAVKVRCGQCEHVFKVDKNASPPRSGVVEQRRPKDPARPWLLRKESGEQFTFSSLATLHAWIVERRVTRVDAISKTGANWKSLGDISELAMFFHAVDQADEVLRELSGESSERATSPPAAGVEESSPAKDVTLDSTQTSQVGTAATELPPPPPPQAMEVDSADPSVEAAVDSSIIDAEGKEQRDSGSTAAPSQEETTAGTEELHGEEGASSVTCEETADAPPDEEPPAIPEMDAASEEPDPAWTSPEVPESTEADEPDDEIGVLADENFEDYRRGGYGKWVAALVVLAFIGVGGAYFFMDDLPFGMGGGADPLAAEERRGSEVYPPPGEDAAQPASDQGVDDLAQTEAVDQSEQDVAVAPDAESADAESLDPAPTEAETKTADASPRADTVGSQVREEQTAAPSTSAASPVRATAEAPARQDTEPRAEPTPPPAPPQPTHESLIRQALNARNRGQIEQALDIYTRASELRPNSAEAYVGQGYCYIEMRAWHAAIAAFEQAIQRNPRHGEAIIGLAEAYKLHGNTARARQHYERYLELYPEGPEAPVATTNLERM